MRTVEQLDAQLALQLPHRGRHRRLRQQQAVSRPCEAHLPRNGDEDGEVADIHTSIMPRSSTRRKSSANQMTRIIDAVFLARRRRRSMES
jgi:hypothetical protein